MTSAQDGLTALEHLDWNTMQCQMFGGCPNQASHIVELHVVDFCDETWLNPFGNTVAILCAPCLRRVEMDVSDQVAKLKRRPVCLTCSASIIQVGDIIREKRKL